MKPETLLSALIIVLSAVVITSCGEDVEKENRSNLLGTWTATDLFTDCDGQETITETLECNDQTCTKYVFQVDTSGIQTYIEQVSANGITESRSGTFSVREAAVLFCRESDGIETCTNNKLKVSDTELQLSSTNEDTGCTETLFLVKDPEN